MSAHDRKIRSPVIASKDNPATDPRQMRRIIAEDPNWSLATVPLLTELCIKHIVHNFEDHPILDGLLPKHKSKVLEALSTGISMKVTSSLVSDEGYWKKCCKSRWEVCDVAKHGDSWKRMYFERNLEGIIESFVPETTDPMPLYETLKLSAAYIKALNIRQLLPPVKEAPLKDDDASDAGSDVGQDGPNIDHFDFGVIIPKLPFLEEIHITYGVRDCGMNFEWNLFQFTSRDCLLLAKAVKACNSLKVFHLHRSQVDDEKVRVLISHLLDHPSLLTLDLSHNKIGDSGARAIGKLINGRCKLTTLNLCDNKIRSNGAAAIGHALGKNQTLNEINLRMNRLGDDGGQAICRALLKNNYLTKVHIGSNDLGEPTAAVIAQVLVSNKILVDLNLSCNKIGPDGGKSLQEGMEENTTIRTMDLRLTEVGQESEYCINQLLKRNRENQYKQNAISDHWT